MSDPIDLFPPEGEGASDPSLPRRPAFLAVYGPAKGYAVETTFTDLFSLKPGVLQFLAATPGLALPAAERTALIGSSSQTLVCRASLRDPQGRVLATATVAKAILADTDVALLETAARRRLAAVLGFGGEVLLADEQPDGRDQAQIPTAHHPTPIMGEPVVKPVVAGKPAGAAEHASLAASPAEPAPLAASPSTEEARQTLPPPAAASDPDADEPAARSPAPPPVAPAAPGAPPPDDAAALALLRRQLAHLAKTRGVAPPAVATRAEAQAAIKTLLRPAAT